MLLVALLIALLLVERGYGAVDDLVKVWRPVPHQRLEHPQLLLIQAVTAHP